MLEQTKAAPDQLAAGLFSVLTAADKFAVEVGMCVRCGALPRGAGAEALAVWLISFTRSSAIIPPC